MGVGGGFSRFFSWIPSKIGELLSKLSVILLLTGVSQQELLFSLMTF